MHDPNALSSFASVLVASIAKPFAYVGLGPGQEFIPQLIALLAFMGTALFAVLQWPFVALLRRLSRSKKNTRDAAQTANVPIPAELPVEDGGDNS